MTEYQTLEAYSPSSIWNGITKVSANTLQVLWVCRLLISESEVKVLMSSEHLTQKVTSLKTSYLVAR